jgi:hypothetical protein
VSTPNAPENSPLLEEIFKIFMEGRWATLGITGERETKLCARIRRYRSEGRTVPSHLLYWAREVWWEHRERILREWEEAIDKATDWDPLYGNGCATCPNCGCPGSE